MELSWKKLSEEPYKAGFRKLLKRRFELPNGITDDFDLYHDGDVATAIVLTPEQKVVTVKHFRPAPWRPECIGRGGRLSQAGWWF